MSQSPISAHNHTLCLVLALLSTIPARAQTRNPLDAVRLKNLTATRERPLFAPTRRPPPAPVEAPPAPAPPPVEVKTAAIEPPPFDLIGAVVGENASYALLRHRSTSKAIRLRPGDEAEAGASASSVSGRSRSSATGARISWRSQRLLRRP